MFSLIKFLVDAVFILFVFYAGMRVQKSYPNLLSSIGGVWTGLGSIYTWLKGLAGKL
jgi:hypothetical protein